MARPAKTAVADPAKREQRRAAWKVACARTRAAWEAINKFIGEPGTGSGAAAPPTNGITAGKHPAVPRPTKKPT